MKKRKPKPITLTLIFSSEEDRDIWLGWYLDGGGAQQCDFYAKDFSKEEMRLVPDESSGLIKHWRKYR